MRRNRSGEKIVVASLNPFIECHHKPRSVCLRSDPPLAQANANSSTGLAV
jgi:hypothetical protein